MFKKGWYRFTAFSTTHNQVLYRMTEHEQEDNVNHDLLFSGGQCINMPFWMEIHEIYHDQSIQLDGGLKRIVVKHREGEGHYDGHRVTYKQNDLPPTQSSIPSDLAPPFTEQDMFKMIKEIEEIGYEQYRELYLKSDWEILI